MGTIMRNEYKRFEHFKKLNTEKNLLSLWPTPKKLANFIGHGVQFSLIQTKLLSN